MKRPLTIIFFIGVMGMLMLAGMGSFFVGKVGGAEAVEEIRAEIAAIYGSRMASPKALAVDVVRTDERNGVRISFPLAEGTARRSAEVDRLVGVMADLVFSRPAVGRTVTFVEFRLRTPDGLWIERRVER
jgi:hypothetical protein